MNFNENDPDRRVEFYNTKSKRINNNPNFTQNEQPFVTNIFFPEKRQKEVDMEKSK